MALVAYDNSDSSDYEQDVSDCVAAPEVTSSNKNKDTIISEPKSTHISSDQNEKDDSDLSHSLFNQLPQPTQKQQSTVVEEDDEFLRKKEIVSDVKPKSRITVPSLKDFADVKDTVPGAKPKILNGKKSGLLSILPQPKNSINIISTSKTLIPHVLVHKPQTATSKKKDSQNSTSEKTKLQGKPASNLSQYSDESDQDDDIQNDFFSIHKPVEVPLEEVPLDVEQPSSSKSNVTSVKSAPRSIESYFKPENSEVQNDMELHNSVVENNGLYAGQSTLLNDNTAPSESGPIEIDDEAILKLCGSRGKRKREDIQIVDVNQQEVLADAREWLLKGLMDDTSKRMSSSKKRGHEPTSQQKRKHQITYLAHQAKANEIELQNQWANNRMTKRQTQSKYGF